MDAATPMFLADAALGRLATWLRLLGYDTVYARGAAESELIRRARDENRVLLTRNTRLLRRRALPPHVFVTSDDFRAQLRQVITACGLDTSIGFLARCSRCNVTLAAIERAEACASVPAYVCATQETFARCPMCGRIYWGATHVERMRAELRRL
jgi:uncharacterized protein with PIN domain